jgi:hypothetical protein
MTNILLAVAATLFGIFLLLALAGMGFLIVRQKRAEMAASRQFCEAVEKLVGAVGKLSEATELLADVPKYIAGHAKAAQAIAIEVTHLRKAVAAFSKLVTAPSDTSSSLSTPTEEEADKSYLIAELLADHPEYTREQAEQLAESDQAFRANLPSISLE